MSQVEASPDPESISQQFINFVIAHSDPGPFNSGQVRSGQWKLNLPLPLVQDKITGVDFAEFELSEVRLVNNYDAASKPAYEIAIFTERDESCTFTYEPNRPNTPIQFRGESPFRASK